MQAATRAFEFRNDFLDPALHGEVRITYTASKSKIQ
jgi:hypothetical protein